MRNNIGYSPDEEYDRKEKSPQASAMHEEWKDELSLLELQELVDAISEEFGVSAAIVNSPYDTPNKQPTPAPNPKPPEKSPQASAMHEEWKDELSLLELQELVDAISEEFGVSAAIVNSPYDTPNKQPTPTPNPKPPEKSRPKTEPKEREKRTKRTIPLRPEFERGIYRLANKNAYTYKWKKQPCTCTNSRRHIVINAAGKKLKSTAAIAAALLLGKHKKGYSPNVDCGDYVTIINCKQAVISDKELDKMKVVKYLDKMKVVKYRKPMKHKPQKVMYDAVKQMLPRNLIGIIRRLRVYADAPYTQNSHAPQNESF